MEKPNYFGILPANVRYDKNLKPMEKILYTEISSFYRAFKKWTGKTVSQYQKEKDKY